MQDPIHGARSIGSVPRHEFVPSELLIRGIEPRGEAQLTVRANPDTGYLSAAIACRITLA